MSRFPQVLQITYHTSKLLNFKVVFYNIHSIYSEHRIPLNQNIPEISIWWFQTVTVQNVCKGNINCNRCNSCSSEK